MSSNNRTWIVLAALVFVVALAYYLLEVQGVADPSDDVDTVWNVESDQVVGIRLADHFSSETVVLERDADGAWWVAGETQVPADDRACQSLVYTLANLRVQQSIEEPPQGELDAYGLADPAYTIALRQEDGRLRSLEVGVRQDRGLYYARRTGDETVLLVPDYAIDEALGFIQSPPVEYLPPATPGVPLIGPETPEP